MEKPILSALLSVNSLNLSDTEKFLFEKLDQLKREAYAETEEMKQLVHELVPTYKIDLRK